MRTTIGLALAVLAPTVTGSSEGFDSFGDPLPEGAVARLGSSRLRHERWVFSLAFSDDGERLLSCSSDGVARLWKGDDGELLRDISTETRYARSASFAGSTLALATAAGTELWNVERDEAPRVVEDRAALARLAPRTGRLATLGEDGVLNLYDAAGKRTHNRVSEDLVFTRVAWAPDGESLVTVATNRNKLLGRAGTQDEPMSRVVYRDAEGAPLGEAIEVFDRPIVAVHVLGEQLITGTDQGEVRFWNLATGAQLGSLESADTSTASMAVSASGDVLALPLSGGRVRLVDGRSRAERAVLQADHAEGAPLAFSPDGTTLAVCTGLGIELWDARAGERALGFAVHEGPVLSLAFAPGGDRLYSGGHDHYLRAWDLSTSRQLWRRYAHTDLINDLDLSGDGSLIVTGSRDGRAILWTDDGAQLHRLAGHSMAVTGVSAAPDGSSVTSVAADKSALTWDPTSGRLLARTEGLVGVLFQLDHLPDGRLLVGGVELKIVEPGHPERSHELLRAKASITALAAAPDGRRAALGLANRTVQLVDLESGEVVRTFGDHRGRIRAVAFTPDATRLVTAAQGDRSVYLWNVEDGTLAATFGDLPTEAESLAVSPDGTLLATGCQNGSILLWPLASAD